MDDYNKNIKTILYESSKFDNDIDIPILKLEKYHQIIGILCNYNISSIERSIEIKISDTTFVYNLSQGEGENKLLPVFYNYSTQNSEILKICKKKFERDDKLILKIFVFC
jgi:hypothetical protein